MSEMLKYSFYCEVCMQIRNINDIFCVLDLSPENSAYYGNRSACHMMLGHYKEALEDALKSVSLDSKFVKVSCLELI